MGTSLAGLIQSEARRRVKRWRTKENIDSDRGNPPRAAGRHHASGAQLALLRGMTGEERVAIALRLTRMAREAARAGIRARHPEYSEDELRRAFFRMLHGDGARTSVRQARAPSALANGISRNRWPVRAKIAFASAGAIGGTPGSPAPACFSRLATISTCVRGVSKIRTSG